MVGYCSIYQVDPVEEIHHYKIWCHTRITWSHIAHSPCIATQSLYVSSGGNLTAALRSTPEWRDAWGVTLHGKHKSSNITTSHSSTLQYRTAAREMVVILLLVISHEKQPINYYIKFENVWPVIIGWFSCKPQSEFLYDWEPTCNSLYSNVCEVVVNPCVSDHKPSFSHPTQYLTS